MDQIYANMSFNSCGRSVPPLCIVLDQTRLVTPFFGAKPIQDILPLQCSIHLIDVVGQDLPPGAVSLSISISQAVTPP